MASPRELFQRIVSVKTVRRGIIPSVPQPCSGPPRPPDELADSLWWLLARAGHLLGGALHGSLAALDLTPRELSVLAAAATRPWPQLGLAAAVGLDKTTMVAAVDALERRGLVRREQHPDDRRVRLVTVSDDGRRLLAQASAAADELERELLAALPTGDRDRLVPLLRALVAAGPTGPARGSCV